MITAVGFLLLRGVLGVVGVMGAPEAQRLGNEEPLPLPLDGEGMRALEGLVEGSLLPAVETAREAMVLVVPAVPGRRGC